jgi:hypothetical protein
MSPGVDDALSKTCIPDLPEILGRQFGLKEYVAHLVT